MKLHVEVTKENICHSERQSATRCPIVFALMGNPNVAEAVVTKTHAKILMFGQGEEHLVAKLPSCAELFISNFDNSIGIPKVEPIEFDLFFKEIK